MTTYDSISWIHTFKANGRKTDLARMAWLLEALGRPQDKFPAIHVVGTNGKGSVTAYLQHILSTSGYQVGTFTSPFIVSFHDRICLNGQPISDQDLAQCVSVIRPVLTKMSLETNWDRPTEFELVTLMMFYYFANLRPVDIAIIEAGIGGKTDATNVFHALAVVCPSISFDHQERLGYTLADIAQQKAGVIKAKEPVIIGQLEQEASQVFQQVTQKSGSHLYQLGKDFLLNPSGKTFSFQHDNLTLTKLRLKLLGRHQTANACLAIMTAQLLTKTFPNISPKSIQRGIEATTWPGRSEFIRPNLLLDGAHNPDSIAKLKCLLQEEFPNRHIHILFAGLKRKPLADLLAQLEPFDISVTTFDFPEANPLNNYPNKYHRVNDFAKWLQVSLTSEDLFVVTGSLYFISEVRQFCLSKESLFKTSPITN
ncbi:UNVERIFIED_CONTAM: bifunctional folylpolyglutamate synthase/dihydrofolate synthase [Streptococcus canis]|uniref:tetrahydrofolate synthase n=1 Tax=Streptococcus canis FSL Z3-227 TaxID=482234 RepID=A0AAV3FS02_STRCB|nr:folylpolyglutamate synthase/dihydrofolate synthase family protein [Streptococcus canis]EIQ81734.1 putative folyl-polyglutamate synthetase [Streptococcus canis FSL Z3-227]MDV5987914.1 bifunctional folylpolyglutamate synthase/dihydrofolate synthase [Streptococcus canis]MDV6000854.1 bifunctional folylpolyglutamate synthase/dihydrofolate synthase [Streptococcus canis]MDV6021720.1 bifunctional folylpolyglutamate synthase/dihydrofolate synthase [Streptococcus canis]VEE25624.1 folylpolyglutamate s